MSMFFTVNIDCNILDSRRVPGVCYEVTEQIRDVVLELAANRQASIYDEEIVMVTGVAYSKKYKGRRVQRLLVSGVNAPSPSAINAPRAATQDASTDYDGLNGFKGTLQVVG